MEHTTGQSMNSVLTIVTIYHQMTWFLILSRIWDLRQSTSLGWTFFWTILSIQAKSNSTISRHGPDSPYSWKGNWAFLGHMPSTRTGINHYIQMPFLPDTRLQAAETDVSFQANIHVPFLHVSLTHEHCPVQDKVLPPAAAQFTVYTTTVWYCTGKWPVNMLAKLENVTQYSCLRQKEAFPRNTTS